ALSSPILLLRVATTWPLPGLGLLAMPAGPTPHLTSLPLHTALPVDLHLPDGSRRPAVGTVEELSRAGAEAMRGLLRDPAPDIW
ncbi:hypothetical protein, partial [Hymenobacter agri]